MYVAGKMRRRHFYAFFHEPTVSADVGCVLIRLVALLLIGFFRHDVSCYHSDDAVSMDELELVSDFVRHLKHSGEPPLPEVPGSDGMTTAFLFQGVQRSSVEMPIETNKQLENFFHRHSNDMSIMFAIRFQRSESVGTIIAIGTQRRRLLEVEYSGRRRELRLHYTHRSRVRTEAFRFDRQADVDLADTRWHVVSIGLVASVHIRIHVDCRPVFERRLPVAITDDWVTAAGGNNRSTISGSLPSTNIRTPLQETDENDDDRRVRTWLGQRNKDESLFKGAIEYVKFVSTSDGFLQQCPQSDSVCPSCSQFRRLEDAFSQLQSTVLILAEQLHAAERRISELESCECRRKCQVTTSEVNNVGISKTTWYRDGETVDVPDACTTCTCKSGTVVCEKQKCPDPGCKTAEHVEGQCCPVCRKHCVFAGERYEHGQTVTPRPCYNCICQDGKMVCEKQLRQLCPRLSCPKYEQILIPGECCKQCRGTDFCSTGNRCHANASCINLTTRYVCLCNRGFENSGNSCRDINECDLQGGHHGHHCHSNAECVNTVGFYFCRCLPGFEQVDSYTCQDIDECVLNRALDGGDGDSAMTRRPCDAKAVCVNTPGSYHCRCRDGYTGDGFACAPACSHPCRNGGQCVDVDVCRCRRGYVGKNCETDVDECTDGLATCDDVSTECVNVIGGYYCQCRPGFRPEESYVKLHERTTIPRSRCVDVDECGGWGGGHSCPHGTVCRNTIGSYRCTCTGSEAQTDCGTVTDCIDGGMTYSHGKTWRPAAESCTVCQCHAGRTECKPIECDCQKYAKEGNHPDYVNGCCTQCSTTCRHQQQPHIVHYISETWHFQCQRCQCLDGGETDCWPIPCPTLSCRSTVQDDGDCCPRCAMVQDPCTNVAPSTTASLASSQWKPCFFRGRLVPSYKSWNLDADSCTVCQCLDGNVCCSYNQSCQTSTTRDSATIINHRQRHNKQPSHDIVELPASDNASGSHRLSSHESVTSRSSMGNADRSTRRRSLFESRTARLP